METRRRPGVGGGGSDRRGRLRLLSRFLALLVLAPLLAYGFAVVNATYDLRRKNALERNESTARLVARLLDEQCDTARSVLGIVARRGGLAAAVRAGDAAAAHAYLRDAVDVVPDLLLVAAYRPDGSLLSQYPKATLPEASAAREPWFRRVAAANAPVFGETTGGTPPGGAPVVTLAVPLGAASRPTGYLFARYRFREASAWLRQIRIPGGAVYVCDDSGRLVTAGGTATEAAPPPPPSLALYPSFRRARAVRDAGHLRAASPASSESVVGYAYAAMPGWVVLVAQPADAALASIDYLVGRLALVLVPLSVVVAVAAGGVSRLYHRQDEMASQLERQNAQLEAAGRMKSDFLANVSHDLRTPLTSLQITVSGLLDPEVAWTREQTREQLEMAGEELDRLSARVRNLLDMARLESGPQTVHRRPGDVTALANGVLERLEPVLRGRAVRADFPPEPLLVEADWSQMETVVSNLLENASKYSPPGTPVHLRGERRGGSVVLAVRDFGPGVPPGDEERVFEKFYRAPSSGSARGTGLGLAICKSVVAAHGGSIRVRNVPDGGGAEFTLSLPALGARGGIVEGDTSANGQRE